MPSEDSRIPLNDCATQLIAVHPIATSKAQKQLWLLAQLEPQASIAYNVCCAVQLNGGLDVDAMWQGIRIVAERHECLRCRVEPGGESLTIPESAPFALEAQDLRPLNAFDQRQAIAREAGREFDLVEDVLFRSRLYRTAEDEHILLIVAHHIVIDGESMRLVLHEIASAYNAISLGQPIELAPACSYQDYAERTRNHEGSKEWVASQQYWLGEIQNTVAPLNLRTDFPRPLTKTFNGNICETVLDKRLSRKVAVFCDQHGTTPFIVLYSAFVIALRRLSGQEEFIAGFNASGRVEKADRKVVGYLTRVLPLKNGVEGGVAARELLILTANKVFSSLEHQNYGLSELIEDLLPQRLPGRSPVLDVIFNFDRGADVPQFERLRPRLLTIPLMTAKYDLDFNVIELSDTLKVEAEFNSNLYLPATIDRLVRIWKRALEGVVDDPDTRIGEMQLLDESERQQVVVEWNQTDKPWPDARFLPEIIAHHARRNPEATAASFEGVQLSYEELNRRANQQAHYLRRLGVGRETRVGVCQERGLELLVAILGIWKAGGVYIALDPAYPRERLGFMLADSAVEVLLTEAGLRDELPESRAQVICTDLEWEELERQSEEEPGVELEGKDLAYVMYTSGSTGKPKGAMIEHGGMMNHLWAKVEELGLGEKDVVAQNAPASFDISVWQLMAAPLVGGQLQIIGDEIARDGFRLLREVDRLGVSVVETVPTLLGIMIAQQQEAGTQRLGLKSLRWMISNAEALPVAMCHDWIKLYPQIPLLNAYGPTECSDDIAHYVADAMLANNRSCAPLGKPLRNMKAYVLDAAMNPVPPGVPGELYIGGMGVGRGYMNRPEMTADKFVPNPFNEVRGERLYRTGDQIRWSGDGKLEFIGRMDDQVKLHGQRLELKEIEAILNEHEPVLRSAVILREDEPGDKRLVAYVVLKNREVQDGGKIRELLKQRLPEYMRPSAILFLEKMPLTVNEKIDRRALPRPESQAQELKWHSAAPRTWMEEALTRIWVEVLRAPQIGIHDDFFELGGHSLLATQVISRIRSILHVELPLRRLFEQPTIARLAETIHQLEQDQQAHAGRHIQTVSGAERLNASYAQQRLWFSHQFDQDKALYNMPAVLKLEGKLEIQPLEAAIDEIVRRHEVLRTAFQEVEGEPLQIIGPPTHLDLPVRDLTQLAPDGKEQEIHRTIVEQVQIPFDLTVGPMIRTLLLRVAPEENLFLLNIHHIAGDEWSLGVFMREFVALYEAFRQGLPSPLPEPQIQYADYGAWQRDWLKGDVLREQLGYWKKQLARSTETVALPMIGPRPAVPSHRGGQYRFQLPGDLLHSLQELSRREGATLFMTLLAAFQMLLHRYSGQDDIVVGSPIASRTSDQTEDLIGFFINIVVLRTDLTGRPSFQQLLRRVKEVALGAYANQDLPFEKLVEELRPKRDLGRTPLFQVLFDLQNDSKKKWEMPGLSLIQEEPGFPSEEFDLAVALTERQNRLDGTIRYRADLFDRSSIERMATHFDKLLQEVIARPQVSIDQVQILSRSERKKLGEWNNTLQEFPSEKLAHHYFEEQARLTPGAVAVCCGEESLTYSELDERANRIAIQLRRWGAGPEARVGICLERGTSLFASVLGSLKSGSAYLPLDPAYPQERLDYMVKDAGIKVLVTDRENASRFANVVTCIVEDMGGNTGAGEEDLLPISVYPDNAAYCIYTSGSTGQPKGVVIEHHSLANFMSWAMNNFSSEELKAVLFSTSICFDISIFELLPALSCGGTIYVVENALQVRGMRDFEKISLINTVPSSMAELIKMQCVPPNVQTVNLCGEALTYQLASNVAKISSVRRLINLYGPTEDTIYATSALIRNDVPREIPIGTPMQNTQAYVLDFNLEPVPVDVFGELYLAGEGVARGYHGRPGTTAESFVPDPFSGAAGKRMYRTGDRARWNSRGLLEFGGRLDHQLKIRGFRIEPGEIESVINAKAKVNEVVVHPYVSPEGEKQLAAYLMADEKIFSVDELKAALRHTLPSYMMPSAFIMMDKLPRTANGKVDRKMLPVPGAAFFAEQAEYVAPATELEKQLCRIWAGVLRLERIGTEQNFFDSGGHSLMATRITSQLRSELGIEVPVRALFEFPTIASFARHLQILLQVKPSGEQKIGGRRPSGPLPLSYAQKRLWFVQQMQPDSVAYNAPLSLRIVGRLDKKILDLCLTEIVARQETLRTTFPGAETGPFQRIHAPQPIELPVLDLSNLDEKDKTEAAERYRAKEAASPFDLATGPLFRAKLIRLSREQHELLLNMHHIVSDGWSREVLLGELLELYAAHSERRQANLPQLKIQYADYAVWEQSWLRGEVLDRQTEYWKRQLNGVAILELPTDHVRPAFTVHPAGELRFTLSKERSHSFMEWGKSEGATPFMVMLAAFQWLLHCYAGQDDVAVGTVVANRTRQEIEHLAGFFVNTLVVRTNVGGAPTFRQLVQRVRETTLDAYAHQNLPFEKLVEQINPERDLGHSPLFQVRFALENESSMKLECAGLKFEEIDTQLPEVKFDLTMVAEVENEGTIDISMVYAADLFDRSTIEKMGSRFGRLLDQATENPDSSLADISVLDEDERKDILGKWNRHDPVSRPAACIHELFESQVIERPAATAAVCEGVRLSYQELNDRANQVACHLRDMGVGPETKVGLYLERNLDLVIGILAILKAGASYVPLDPSNPRERTGLLLEDSKIPALLTSEKLRSKLPSMWIQLVSLDGDADTIGLQPTENGNVDVSDRNLAYLIYTSGSTGKPKAVEIEHRNLVNYLHGVTEQMQCSAGWRYAMVSTVAADLGNTVLFASLCTGGELHLLSDEVARDARLFSRYMREQKIQCTKITPSHLMSLQMLQSSADLLPEKLLVLGGESAQWQWVNELRAMKPACRIINHYGPTECTVGALTCKLDEIARWGTPRIPLGAPLHSAQVYVLNDDMTLHAPGLAGELYIGGAGVGRGYLERPDITAERFVPDPFSKIPGSRLYRTGDNARWRSDGAIEFLGRKDHQVKIRGFRVELEEIETVLMQHPDIRQAAVAVHERESEKSLAAYVCLRNAASAEARENLYQLPNGMRIAHQNQVETDYLYREIFGAHAYLSDGITLPPDACVFDVGANIGMFTLFAGEKCPQGRIYSFEPIEPLHRKLEFNARLSGAKIKTFNIGLSDRESVAEFAFFPRYSMMSGKKAYSDLDVEVGVITKTLQNRAGQGDRDAEALLLHGSEFLREKFLTENQLCRLRRLSDVIREQEVEFIDLLKIDVQRAEVDVLDGIDDQHWENIGQIVMEVHDGWKTETEGRLRLIVDRLKQRGFEAKASQYEELKETDRWNIYSWNQRALQRRKTLPTRIFELPPQEPVAIAPTTTSISGADLREYLRQRLPDYMVPAVVALLPNLPLTANGKIDRRALPEVDEVSVGAQFEAPRNDLERQLCGIWEEVLHVPQIGIHDNFFESGGHSLLATQVVARIESALECEVSLTAIFRSPTIEELAVEINQRMLEKSAGVDVRIKRLDREAQGARYAAS